MPSHERNASLDHLDPSREYFLSVVSVSFLGTKNESRPVLFVSPANDSVHNPWPPGKYPIGYGHARKIPKFRQRVGTHQINPYAAPFDGHDHHLELPFIKVDEAIIIVVILCCWFGIIVMFCNKWGKIRHLEPYQPDFRKRESTDTEVIVDPFSSFSTPHYNPRSKYLSRMNTVNTTGNEQSFSFEANPGVNFIPTNDRLSVAKRKASLSLNDVNTADHHRRTYSHGSGARMRFNYQSFSPRLYHCQSTGIYYPYRRPPNPSTGVVSTVVPTHHHTHHPRLRHLHRQIAIHTTPCSFTSSGSHGGPSISRSSSGAYSPSRRHSSVQQNAMSSFNASPPTSSSHHQIQTDDTLEGAVGGTIDSEGSPPAREYGSQVRHHSLLPLPPNFTLCPGRKIKSAEDLKSLVLELTLASRNFREEQQEQLIAETYQ